MIIVELCDTVKLMRENHPLLVMNVLLSIVVFVRLLESDIEQLDAKAPCKVERFTMHLWTVLQLAISEFSTVLSRIVEFTIVVPGAPSTMSKYVKWLVLKEKSVPT